MSAVTFSMTHAVHDRLFSHTHAHKEKKITPIILRSTHMAHKDKGHTQISTYYKRDTCFIHVMCMHIHRHTRSNLVLPGSENDWGCLTYILADMYTGREEMKSLSLLLSLSLFHILCSFQCLFIASRTHTHIHTYTQWR